MPIYKGLRVELQKHDVHLHAPPFKEYESSECVSKGSGLSYHCLLRLPTDIRFQILVSADATFQWEGANALRIQVDFDEGQEVKDAAVFVIRPARLNMVNAPLLTRTVNGDEYIQLSRIGHPIEPYTKEMNGGLLDFVDEEQVSFRMVSTNNNEGGPLTLHGAGVIRVAVYACVLTERSGRPQASYGVSSLKKPRRDKITMSGSVAHHSRVELFHRIQQPSVPHNFRSKKADMVGLFIFHYHTPEVFERLKALDEEGHTIQDAGHRKRRVLPNSPEPNDIPSSDRSTPPRQDSETVFTPEQAPPDPQDHAFGHDEDTIVVLTDNSDVDAMDVDEPGSAETSQDSVTDSMPDADNDMDKDSELARLQDRTVTTTELDFVLDRSEAIAAEIEENKSRMQDEYYDAIKELDTQRALRASIVKEFQESKESKQCDLLRLNEEVTQLEADNKRLDVEVAKTATDKFERKESKEFKQRELQRLKEEGIQIEAYDRGLEEEIEQAKANNLELKQKRTEHQEMAKQAREEQDELFKGFLADEKELNQQNRVLQKAAQKK